MVSYCGSRSAYFFCRNPATSSAVPATSADQSTGGAQGSTPGNRPEAAAPCTASAARIIALDGTQPTFTQVPPIVPWPTSATRKPASAAVIEAENPAEPAPTTIRS